MSTNEHLVDKCCCLKGRATLENKNSISGEENPLKRSANFSTVLEFATDLTYSCLNSLSMMEIGFLKFDINLSIHFVQFLLGETEHLHTPTCIYPSTYAVLWGYLRVPIGWRTPFLFSRLYLCHSLSFGKSFLYQFVMLRLFDQLHIQIQCSCLLTILSNPMIDCRSCPTLRQFFFHTSCALVQSHKQCTWDSMGQPHLL